MKRTNQKRIISYLRHKHLFQDEKMQLEEIETAQKIDGLEWQLCSDEKKLGCHNHSNFKCGGNLIVEEKNERSPGTVNMG